MFFQRKAEIWGIQQDVDSNKVIYSYCLQFWAVSRIMHQSQLCSMKLLISNWCKKRTHLCMLHLYFYMQFLVAIGTSFPICTLKKDVVENIEDMSREQILNSPLLQQNWHCFNFRKQFSNECYLENFQREKGSLTSEYKSIRNLSIFPNPVVSPSHQYKNMEKEV